MNKKDLVKYISDKVRITENDASIIMDVLMDGIKEGLNEDGVVKIRHFGTFSIEKRKARKINSPYDGSIINVPEKNAVKFKVSKEISEMVNEK